MTSSPAAEAAASGTALSILNPNPRRIPGPSLLHELVGANSSDGSPALDYSKPNGERKLLSFEELHQCSEVLAARISEALPTILRSEKSFVVPILVPQCPALYVSILAILKAGGAFCPLNLDAPCERIRFILGDVAAKVVLTTADLAPKLPSLDGSVAVIIIGDEITGSDARQIVATPRRALPEDLAYVMYTSGSTGTPKGVGISHDAVTQSLLAHDRQIPKFSRFLQFAAPTFDVSVFEIFFPLFRGSTLVSCNRAEMLNDLPTILRTLKVDACELTPTVAGGLLRSREDAPGLRLLLTIGEMLTEPVVREFGGDLAHPSILWAMYGPTEATIHCTLQPAFAISSVVGNIGTPLDTVSTFVVRELSQGGVTSDGSLAEVEVLPVGEVGELAVGGHQLACGYINRPEQTSAAFINTKYGRLYRTGDKARLTPGGVLECLGRISDGQVKLRGQRIELGEVEQAMLRTRGCHGAVAAVIAGNLVAFCTADDIDDTEHGILETCRAWLPRFMIPGDIVLLREFPRLPSGKVDRKRLVAEYSAKQSSEKPESTSITDELDKTLRNAAGQVLGKAVSSSLPLAASGMDSLSSIRFASLLRSSGLQVSAIDVMDAKTISHLRARICNKEESEQQPSTNGHHALEVDLAGIVSAIPSLKPHVDLVDCIIECTSLQTSMLAETTLNSQAYCNFVELAFPKECSLAQIRSWFALLAQGNEILRTGFAHHDGSFVQVIWKDLSGSQIQGVDEISRDFCIDSETALLRPFHIQIKRPPTQDEVRVLLAMHHSLYDGWSVDLIIMDLNSLLRGEDVPLRPQFREVLEHQKMLLRTPKSNKARQFWAETLVGFQATPTPELRVVSTKAPQTFAVESLLGLDNHQVKKISQGLQCSPQVVFQAALVWLWSVLVASDDIVIGTVNSGRTSAASGIEAIMGPCIQIAPLRVDKSRVRTIKELLGEVQITGRATLPNCFLPLSEIKRAAQIPPSRSLYEVLFVYQESLYSKAREEGIIKEITHRDYVETDLLVEVEPTGRDFLCRMTYRSEAFPTDQVKTIMDQLGVIARHMCERIDEDVSSTRSCLPTNLLSQHNVNPVTFSGQADLAKAVEAIALRVPEKDAICFATRITSTGIETETVTYHELNRLANRIARHVRSSGAAEGDAVAIVMEKSIILYAGVLGIIKAGCAYLPLLPTTPLARTKLVLKQANIKLCLADSKAAEALGGVPCEVIDLQAASLDGCSHSDLPVRTDPSRVVNIVYTSGSTGTPKGVCVTNLNIISNLEVLSRIYPVRDGSRLLQSCSQAFDVSVFEIFFAWTRGICLCSAVNDVLFEDIENAIQLLEVTHLSMTPTVASLVNPDNVPKVEFIVTSGEPMTEQVARAWTKQLYQGYGPSETTNICTAKKMESTHVIRHLGHGFENTSSFVLYPESYDVVPKGAVGELCFGGDQVTAGYLNLPEMTAEKFINHPHHGRMYRSGDLGRMLPDGSLMIISRMDDQIKLRGQRIELNEINSLLRHSGKVSTSITLLVTPRNSTSQQLITFYVPSGEKPSTSCRIISAARRGNSSRDIFQSLRSGLPSYMVPSYLVPISAIPLTAQGKADKDFLKHLFQQLGQQELASTSDLTNQAKDDAQWTESELKIAAVLCEALGAVTETIGRWTPLQTLGLDSISAIKVAKLIRQKFGCRIPVSQVLRNDCVVRLAQATVELDSLSDPDYSRGRAIGVFSPRFISSVSRVFKTRGLVIERILPCTPLQEGMLASPAGRKSYVNRMLFRLLIPPDEIQKALLDSCRRHGIFRTCFVATDNSRYPIAQIVLDDLMLSWKFLIASDTSMDALVDKQALEMPEAIDSYRPPVSFAIIRQGEVSFLSFICHHALYDGEAIEQLFWEVESLYQGKPLPPPPSYESFLECALSLPQTVDSFWGDHLSDFRPTMMLPGQHGSGHRQRVVSQLLNLHYSEIDTRLRCLGFTPLSLFQSSWASLLSVLFKTNDICFGNVFNGRSVAVERVEELVAPCFNTVPLRVEMSDIKRNVDLMKYFRDLNPEVLRHQFTPLRRIQRRVSLGVCHLFDTLLLLQRPSRPLNDQIWKLERDDGEMDFPLVCEVFPNLLQDGIEVRLHHDSHYISNTSALLISDLLSAIIESTLKFPSSQTFSYQMLPRDLKSKVDTIDLLFDTPAQEKLPSGALIDGSWTKLEITIRSSFLRLSSIQEHDIRRDATIYQLGLDSINAVQLASFLRKQGMDVSATEVMDHPSCAELAKAVEKRGSGTRDTSSYDLEGFRERVWPLLGDRFELDGHLETILPCTPLQNGLLAEFIQSKGQSYFNCISFQLDAVVEIDNLIAAWKLALGVDHMLRTGFVPVDQVDTSFAMIQYPPETVEVGPTVSHIGQDTNFNLDKWRLDVRREALGSLERPPWRLAIVEKPNSVTVHFAIHHALYDAFSLQRLLGNVTRALRGHPLEPVPRTEMAVCDILSHVSTCAASASGFWQKLAGQVTINNFPTMTSLRVDQRNICVESITCPSSFWTIEAAIRKSGFTIQSVLQAAWARVLSSYLGEPSVAFGVVLSGRNSESTLESSFPCISTLPVICQNMSSNMELVDQMMRYNMDLHKYQHTPLNRIKQWLGCCESRLFDTLLVYQKLDTGDQEPHPWKIIDERATVDYSISVEVEPKGSILEYRVTFFDDVLPPKQARLLLAQFDAVFRHILFYPDESEGLLFKNDLAIFSVTPAAEPELHSREKLLHNFVEFQARKRPDSTALRFVNAFRNGSPVYRDWTYRELDFNGNRAANMISEHVRPGSIVATCFDKCPEAYFAILGVLKSGCSFVALDPGAPPIRKQFIVQDSGAALLLTDKSRAENLGFEVNILVVVVNEDALTRAPVSRVHLSGKQISPQSSCYCLYTSGTTGAPKGCEITHENAVQAMLAFQKLFTGHWDKDSRWLQFASFHFDVSVLEQYWTWSVGITLVAATRDLILEDLAGTISRLEITHIDLTPSLARLLHPSDVPSLTRGVFITGGEQLRQEILDAWGPTRAIHNFYGPTEATIGVTTFPCVPQNGRSSNIGKQFPNVGSYVLRPGTETPVLRGGVGELCVSGKLVGKGYLNRDDLTRERFPTLSDFNERVYRTGDIVRILHDGCFEFLGRADDQVKLRGQRLEIGEIDHAIRLGVPEVLDVATLILREPKRQKDLLVSFVVTEPSKNNTDLRVNTGTEASGFSLSAQDACRARLPGYMVPSHVLCVPFVPLSTNNKADVKQLKTLFHSLSQEELMGIAAGIPEAPSRKCSGLSVRR